MCLVGESLEAALAQEGDSEEEDAIVNQVLDEIGITIKGQVRLKLKISFELQNDEFSILLFRSIMHLVFQAQRLQWYLVKGTKMMKMPNSKEYWQILNHSHILILLFFNPEVFFILNFYAFNIFRSMFYIF